MNVREQDPYRPTGRRHYEMNDEHKAWNFLQHYPCQTKSIQFIDSPNAANCRFGKGFQRKPLQKIWPDQEKKRVREWENALRRRSLHEEQRKQLLTTKNNVNGNLLTAEIPQENTRELFLRKRKIVLNDAVSVRDKQIRDKVSKNRFFHPELSKRPQVRKIDRDEKQYSSDIRIGRNDLESNGTLDAFSGHGY